MAGSIDQSIKKCQFTRNSPSTVRKQLGGACWLPHRKPSSVCGRNQHLHVTQSIHV